MSASRRIGIALGVGYVPGLNCVIAGAVLAASQLGWEAVGIHDSFDGLLFPDRYPGGGILTFAREADEDLLDTTGANLGIGARSDPLSRAPHRR